MLLFNQIFGSRFVMPDAAELRNRALDGLADINDRIGAILALGQSTAPDALRSLLELGERQAESIEIMRATGTALAARASKGAEISEWDLRNIQGPVVDTFCEPGA